MFPLRAERKGTSDSSSPEWTPDPGVHSRAPLPLLKGAVCFPWSNTIPTFVMLSGVFTPILPKPIVEGEQIQLLLISNRLSFQGTNLKMCHGYALWVRVVGVLGPNKEGELLWLAVNWQLRQTGESVTHEQKKKRGYGFITKEGQWDEHWLWKYVCLR